MKKNLTELVFIIDRSGSMFGYEKDTIGGFNSTVEKQREGEGEVLVSTVLFSGRSRVLHDRVNISKIEPMTERDYHAEGNTALLDAVGDAIHHISNIHKYAREEDIPEKTIFVITTDGMENASRRYGYRRIKAMIQEKTERFGWEFVFLGANINAAETAEHIGIRRDRSANYSHTGAGVRDSYRIMSCAISDIRRVGDAVLSDYEEEENNK